MQSFKIELKAESWNTLARKHYRVYTKVFTVWKNATFYAVKKAKIKPIAKPVRIVFTAYWKHKRRRDLDNILTKPILDSLVDMNILEDDSTEFVKEIVLHGKIGAKEDCLFVQIDEI